MAFYAKVVLEDKEYPQQHFNTYQMMKSLPESEQQHIPSWLPSDARAIKIQTCHDQSLCLWIKFETAHAREMIAQLGVNKVPVEQMHYPQQGGRFIFPVAKIFQNFDGEYFQTPILFKQMRGHLFLLNAVTQLPDQKEGGQNKADPQEYQTIYYWIE